jgi:eukaryotic-like serine/threonine-protein kinase
VWDATTGQLLLTYRDHEEFSHPRAADPSVVTSHTLSSMTIGRFRWLQSPLRGYSVAWSPDGTRIASGCESATSKVRDAITGEEQLYLSGCTSIVWSPDGTRIATAYDMDKTVQVWDAADGRHVYTYRGHRESIVASGAFVVWSPDGTRIASGSSDKTVQVWDAADGRHVYTYYGHSKGITAVAWSPDGTRIASGSSDKTVQVWDAK